MLARIVASQSSSTQWVPMHPAAAARRLLCAAAAVLVLLMIVSPAAHAESLCTDTWTGPAEGSWSTASDWSSGTAPTSSDVACVGTGKTVKVEAGTNATGVLQGAGAVSISGGSLEIANALEASSIAGFTQKGGTLTGPGALTVTSSFSFGEGSTMSGSGETVIAAGVSGLIDAGSGCESEQMHLIERVLVNEGSTAFKWGTVLMSEGAKIENKGTFASNSEAKCPYTAQIAIPSGSKVEPHIDNTGMWEKTEATSGAETVIGVSFVNEGSVKSNTHALSFSAGGSAKSGSWSAATGDSLSFSAGSYSLTEGTIGPGAVNVTGGALSTEAATITASIGVSSGSFAVAHGSETVGTISLTGGTLTGAGTLNVTSSFSLGAASTMSGSGKTVIESGASGLINASSGCESEQMHLIERVLVNEGSTAFKWGTVLMSEGAKIENKGTFTDNSEASCPYTSQLAVPVGSKIEPHIVNTGTWEKTENTSTGKQVGVSFANEGNVKSNKGTLAFAAGGSGKAGSWSAAAGDFVAFSAGSFSLTEDTIGPGTVKVTGGALTGENIDASGSTVAISSGSLTIKRGALNASSLSLAGGSLDLADNTITSSVQTATVEKATLTGTGTLEVTSSFSLGAAGTMSGSGKTVIASGASGLIDAGSGCESEQMHLSERTLVNNGSTTFKWGALLMSEGAKLENKGTFADNSEAKCPYTAQIAIPAGNKVEPSVVNAHTWEKTENTGTSTVEPAFHNYGAVNDVTGKIAFDNPITPEPATQYGSLNPSELSLLRAICGDPVNCVTGNLYESQTDIAVGGRGVGLNLTRYYNAQAAAQGEHGAFGYGWTSAFSDHVVYSESGKAATVVQANGSTVPFSEESSSWKAPAWTQDKLTGNSSEGYNLTLADQTVYKFASSGRLESVADRNGNTTSLTYNEKGQLTTITDPSGRTIKLAYNAEGLVESATDPMGHVVKYTYESGNLATVTLPGQSSPRWHFKYDGSHRMTSMVNGISGETTNTYNGSNQVTSQKDPAGHTLKWEYEPFKTKITNESTGSVTLEQYTSVDKVNAITHGYGTEHTTTETFTYNEAGEPLTRTDGNEHTTSYEYDSEGNKVKQTDPEGHETKWTYNAKHEVTSETLPSGEKTSIEYDEHGNPVKVSRPAPKEETQETRYEYNAHGEMTAMIDPELGEWKYGYDEAGDRTSETDPEGNKTTWAYNEDSQKTSEVSPAGNVEGGKPAEYTTSIERNALGQPVKITRPEGKETSYEYNADGDQTAATDPNGHKTEVTYNSEDKPVEVKQPSGATQETEYNGAGQIVKQTDGNKHATTYVRNVHGQVTEETNPLEHKTKKTYDAAGNLVTLTDAAGRTTTYSYNKENQLTRISYSEAGTHTAEYEYTPDGQLSSMSDGTGTTSYTYDQLGRLIETKDGHGDVVSYGYDLANQITSITYPNGKTIKDAYDKAGRLTSVSDWLSHTTSFSYTPESQVATESFPEATGESDHYTYTRAGELAETKMLKGSETLASIAYKRDSLGQVTKATQTGLPGAEATEYAYTTNEQLETAGSAGYEYDAAGNLTKIGSASNTFNAADQLTEGAGVTYAYNEVGQRTKATPTTGPATSYGYDQAGNLTLVARPEEGSTPKIEDSYTYNGDDLRAAEIINGTTRYLIWQLTGALPLLLSDGTNSYIYGPEGAPIEEINSNEEATYLHHDQQGSTRLLTNEKGEAVGSYTYTPYGAIEKHEGTATTALGYDGQFTSSETGLIYLRARVYDPATAQFLSVDPIGELTRQPYNYALDNPLNLADPSGLCGLLEVSCYVEEGAKEVAKGVEAGAEWVGEHPAEAAGIALGAVSVATGVGAIAAPIEIGEITIGSAALGTASVATGSVGAALDAQKCLESDEASACTGFGLNAAGAGFGLVSTLMEGGIIESSAELKKLLEYAGVSTAALGLGVDVLSLPELRELLCE